VSAITLTPTPRHDLLAVEVWTDGAAFAARFAAEFGVPPPPAGQARHLGAGRILWVEPGVWWLRTPPADAAATLVRLTAALADDGAATDISGGFLRQTLTGPAWRALLMLDAVFDAEDPAFAPGHVAATLIAHTPVRLDVIGPDAVDVYMPPSLAGDLLAVWTRATARVRSI
jgi:heterotetrameric sarcosine oxidase gamma subunit